MPKLSSEVVTCTAAIDALLSMHASTGSVEVRYRKVICEIALLRVFYLLENTFKALSCRIASGASYCDGSNPVLLLRCSSIGQAEQHMKNVGRAKPRNLKWSQATEIKENLKYLVDPSDHLIKTFDAHGSFIDEVRRVRNRIAHNNDGVRTNYRVIVKRYYGADLRNISPGTLLLSPRRSPPLIESYLLKAKLLVKTLARA